VKTPTDADVVVVGAGFAGLSTARHLSRLSRDVIVLEGRDRVGGRSLTTTIAGVPVDLGGTFVGPTQDEVLKLAAELGCETVPTHNHGTNLIRWRGRVRSYRSTIPRLSMIELLDVSRIQWRFERLSRSVSLAEPWTSPNAHRLDELSLESWLRSVYAGASTRDLMAIMARVTWGGEPEDVSMLHAVRYIKAAGGLGPMLDVEGGAQQDRFPGGTQQIALKMAEELGDAVHRDAIVRRIERLPDGNVVVHTDAGATTARAVVVAIPPEHRGAIAFEPALPQEYGDLAAGQPQQGLRRLRHAVLAGRRPVRRGTVRRRPRVHHVRRQPERQRPRHPAGVYRRAHLRPAARRRAPQACPRVLRRAVRRRGADADRLRRPLLGHRGIRAWRTHGCGAPRVLDELRPLVAPTR